MVTFLKNQTSTQREIYRHGPIRHGLAYGVVRADDSESLRRWKATIQTIQRTLHNHLRMKKLKLSVCCWVLRMLTDDQKRKRHVISQQLLDRMCSDKEEFLSSIVTQDETWVHHFEPESKQQSKAWKHLGSPARLWPQYSGIRKVYSMIADVSTLY